jgi:hypothetical protein
VPDVNCPDGCRHPKDPAPHFSYTVPPTDGNCNGPYGPFELGLAAGRRG